MRRRIARWQNQWLQLFVLAVIATAVFPLPVAVDLPLMAAPFLLFLVRPPRSTLAPVDLTPPVHGRWVALNSPGSAVPSHGVRAYGQAYAVDLLQPAGPGAPTTVGWSLPTRRPEQYRTFGEPVVAMAGGTVVRATDRQRDHRGRDTWPALIYMMTIEGFLREVAGARWILGNHVIVQHDDGTYAAYAHLRRGSLEVRRGERVAAGRHLAAVGNTGNTSEPHLHVQLMDRAAPTAAAGVPFRWPTVTVVSGDVDPTRATGEPASSALAGVPANGQIFEAASATGTKMEHR